MHASGCEPAIELRKRYSPGADVVLTGGRLLTTWTLHSSYLTGSAGARCHLFMLRSCPLPLTRNIIAYTTHGQVSEMHANTNKPRGGNPHTRSRGRGFSLVELLVVAGMIVLLLAVLLPLLSRARLASSQIACTANLRQWAGAAQLYALANNGYLPRRGQGVQPTSQINRPQNWFNALPPTLGMRPYSELAAVNQIPRPDGGRSVWICPGASDFVGANYWSGPVPSFQLPSGLDAAGFDEQAVGQAAGQDRSGRRAGRRRSAYRTRRDSAAELSRSAAPCRGCGGSGS